MKIKLVRKLFSSKYRAFNKAYAEQKRMNNINLMKSGNKTEIERIKQAAIKNYEDYEFEFNKSFKSKDEYIDYVLKGITEGNPHLLTMFAKNAKKGNIDEDSQILFLKQNYSEILDNKYKTKDTVIAQVPKSLQKYFVNNKIIFGKKEATKINSKLHSIDVELIYKFLNKTYTGFCTLKFASGNGGAQNEAVIDVITTNEEFIKSTDKNLYTFSVIDGSRFFKEYKNLVQTFKTDRNKITNCDKFGQALISTIIKWLKESFPVSSLSDSEKEELENEISRLSKLSVKYRLENSLYN